MKPKTRSARVRVRLLFGCAAACVGCLGAVFLWRWRCLQIGRASCRESVYISVGAESLRRK